MDGLTYEIDWGENFGGGILEIQAKTTIEGIEVFDTYTGVIEGETLGEDTSFIWKVKDYLEKPEGVDGYQSILTDVGQPLFFRVIAYHEGYVEYYEDSTKKKWRYAHFERLSDGPWKKLGPVLGYSSDYVYPVVNKAPGSTYSKPSSDGGFGVMQLTMWGPENNRILPTYEQIWNWKKNVDGAVWLIKYEKLPQAKAYPILVKMQGCTEEPKYIQGKKVYPCRPLPVTERYEDAEDFDAYELRMDVYSLYNSNWHYWIWNNTKTEWDPWKSKIKAQKRGFRHANRAKSTEESPPNDF